MMEGWYGEAAPSRDAALRQQFRDFVFSHVRQYHLPTILVTHDLADAADASRTIHLQAPC